MSKRATGPVVAFDAERVRRMLALRDVPITEIERRCGFYRTGLCKALARGRCGLYALDALAVELGMHPSELIIGDWADVKPYKRRSAGLRAG